MLIKTWHVEIFIDEDEDDTSARAVLHADSPGHPEGLGHARRSPTDVTVPEIGDEVAAARALHALADAVLNAAAHDIEAIEHRAVHLTFEGATTPAGAVISHTQAQTGPMWRSLGEFRP